MQQIQFKIFFYVFILIGIAITAYIFFGNYSNSSSHRFGFPVKHTVLTQDIDFYEFRSSHEYLEITEMRQINQEIAEQLVDEKVMLFLSLFERQRVGYKGQHTEFIECPDKFKPRLHESLITGGELRYFIGFANDRYVLGSCDQETSKHYAVNAFMFCPSLGRLLDIRYFQSMTSADSVQTFIDKLTCENIN